MRRVNLVEGSVGAHLLSLGVFLAMSMLAIMSIGIADVYFVGRLGHHELAALTFTYPIVMIGGTIAFGLGNGVVAVIARAIGEGDLSAVQKLSTDSIVLAILITVVLVVPGYIFLDPLFRLMGAGDQVMPFIKQYMHVWLIGIVTQMVPQTVQNALRAFGDTRTLAIITTTMCAMNVALDPILIFGWGFIPPLGIAGAALAGILSRSFQATCILSVLHFRMKALAPVQFSLERIRSSWRRLLHIGLPAIGAQIIQPMSQALLTKIVALSGLIAVAGYGVATRIEMLTMGCLFAAAGALPAFIGQNAGAGRMDRVQEAVRIAVRFSVAAGLILAVLALVGAPAIVAQFTDSLGVVTVASHYLQIVATMYALTGLMQISIQAMNALHRPLMAGMVSVARACGLSIPLALIGHWLGGIHGVFVSIAVSNAACGAMGMFILYRILRQEDPLPQVAAA
jgi:putative MATE family efflux protein